ncbi:TetR/AcrR family transcriptional regulator [Streptomyces sp. NBC_00457]|uniref:TetR/AcrR family transcriptional regulator n=1 Tax=unclassified Streptomyces TaxID=2593676 RepID=UPI0030E1CF8C
MTPPRSTLRADAQRNREHLIATAAEAFASGRAISLDAIAKRAGVGSGTLYRHFPTRARPPGHLAARTSSPRLDAPLRRVGG